MARLRQVATPDTWLDYGLDGIYEAQLSGLCIHDCSQVMSVISSFPFSFLHGN